MAVLILNLVKTSIIPLQEVGIYSRLESSLQGGVSRFQGIYIMNKCQLKLL